MSDGTLIFDTKIDTSGMDSGMLKIQNKSTKATAAVSRQTQAVQKLEAEMQKLKTAQVPTEQYAQLDSAMQKADTRLMSLIDTQDKYLATGGSMRGTQWNRLQYDIEKASAEVREYQAQMAAMRSDGSAFTRDSMAIQKVSADLDTAKVKLQELQMKEQEAALSLKEATSPKDPEAITRATNKASSSMATFGKRISSVLRSALIFTVITQLAAKFRDYIGKASVANDELRTALGKLKGALQTAFTPIFQAALPALTSLANALAKVITLIGQFIGLLFGTGSGTGTAKLKSATVSLMSTAGETTEALDGETASLMALSDASDDAEKSMASFDEINQLGNKSSGSGPTDTGIPTLTPDAITMPTWLTDAAEKVGAALKRIGDAADRISKSKAFKVITDFLGKLATSAFIGILDGIARAFESLAGSLETIDKFASGDFGGGLLSWLKSVWDLFTSSLTPLGAYYQLLETIAIAVYNFFKNLDLGKWWAENVAPWFTQERWLKLWDDVKYVWSLKWAEIVAWWKTTALYKWWTEDVAPWFTSARWQALFESALLGVQAGWASVKTWWNNTAIVRWWNDDVLPWFTKDKWYNALSGIKEGFTAAFDDAKLVVKGAINSIIGWLNSVGNLSWEAKTILGQEVVPAGNIKLWHIPPLANGAVIPPNREFLAMLGDQTHGTNIEAPLDTIVSAFRKVTREGNGGGKGEAVMEVDGQAFGRLVFKYGNKEAKRVGVRLAGV